MHSKNPVKMKEFLIFKQNSFPYYELQLNLKLYYSNKPQRKIPRHDSTY